MVCEEEGEESTHWLGHQGCRGPSGGLPPPEASSPLVSHFLGSVEPFFLKFPSSMPIVYGLKPLLCPLELPTHHQEDLHPHLFLQMASSSCCSYRACLPPGHCLLKCPMCFPSMTLVLLGLEVQEALSLMLMAVFGISWHQTTFPSCPSFFQFSLTLGLCCLTSLRF